MFTIKKSLGQHFLHDENVCQKIVAALQQYPFEQLLEVGPGAGAITKYLIKIPSIDFKAIELDREKIAYLGKKYPDIAAKLIEADILNTPVPFEKNFTLVGNFPYNISSQILFKVVEWKDQVDCMVGMFQKEVAQRVASPAGSKVYGVTSVLIQAFFAVDYLFEVGEASFTPPPKVKSAVIRLRALKVKPHIKSERALFSLVKTAFNQRRK
ncbi:MAG: 16S rRNA (adenine(1518)-N(6)/adenine(1519)-N(6))-dimethyltransferase RsmA, partial [Chitinophagaceae bacterium]